MQSNDHHAEDYEDYEGHPDGRDLYDAHIEANMSPSLDEQLNAPEFRLQTLELWVARWTPRILEMDKTIGYLKQIVSIQDEFIIKFANRELVKQYEDTVLKIKEQILEKG